MSRTTLPTVASIDPRRDVRWQELAAAGGGLFTSPPWIRAVCDTYGFTPQARITLGADGVARDGFVWVPISDLRGERLASLPFSDHAEPILRDRSAWPDLVHDALDPVVPLIIRCRAGSLPADDGFTRTAEAALHTTALAAPLADIYRAVHPSARRAVAGAERRGVEVKAHHGIDAIRTFHDMHVALRKNKYRMLAQPVEFFERIWEEFNAVQSVVTIFAYHDGAPIAGAVLLAWGDTLYFKFAASRAEALALMPNYAVYWQTIKWAAEHAFARVDWGLSDLDQPGLVAYKRKWASAESRVVTLRTAQLPGPPAESASLLAGLTTLLTEEAVPDEITTRAGALLYRHFA